MTTPTTITDVSGYGWGDLTYRTSDSDYHYYTHSWDSTPFAHDVRVKFTTGTGYNEWSDGNTSGDPSTIDDNADGYVYCYNSTPTLLIKFLKPTTASWISAATNVPYVTWYFPDFVCGQTTSVGVTHTVAQSSSTTYYVYELGVGQIGTIIVGTGAYPSTLGSGNFPFTISSRTIQVISPGGALLGQKVFTCPISSGKKVHTNFW